MKLTAQQGDIARYAADLIVVNLFEGVARPGGATGAVDAALGGQITSLIAAGDFAGRLNETALLYVDGKIPARRVLVVGLGPAPAFDAERARQAAGTAARRARDLGVAEFATIVHGAGIGGLDLEAAAQAVAEGSLLGLYQFREYKNVVLPGDRVSRVGKVVLLERDAQKVPAIQSAAQAATAIVGGVVLARDLVNRPALDATPEHLADQAQQIAHRYGLRCQTFDRAQIRSMGMGALYGVALASLREPKFIVLESNPDGTSEAPIVLVGKGLTFDSGGLDLKSQEQMARQKGDMAGAAAVLGAMEAIGALGIRRRVVALIPATENMPSGSALHPGDIVTTITGKTIEVLNTDGEGRLVLSDALGYAQQLDPAGIVDLATLTGAAKTALGAQASALFANDETMAVRMMQASQASGERLWRLPLFEEFDEAIRSDIADIKNTGGDGGGASIGAAVLKQAVGACPWAHVDFGGTTMSDLERGYIARGGTGFGVRLLVELVQRWQ